MRHQVKRHRIGRSHSHRKATLAAMTMGLFQAKRITTTLAKARALRVYVEPLISRSKDDTTHNRREVFRHLQNKEAVKVLFDEIGEKVAGRPGGYTRIVKLGRRAGDGAPLAVIELVDYNDVRPEGASTGKRRTRRSSGRTRRSGGEGTPKAAQPATKPETTAKPAPTGNVAGPEGDQDAGAPGPAQAEEQPVDEAQATPVAEPDAEAAESQEAAQDATAQDAAAQDATAQQAEAAAEGDEGEAAGEGEEGEEKK